MPLKSICQLFFCLSLSWPALSQAKESIKTLYLTDFNNTFHDYDQTQKTLQSLLHQKLNIDITLVGRKSQDSLDLLKRPGFLEPYQLFIYNACFSDNTDLQLLRNLHREIKNSGVPTVFLHCGMHNFRWTSTNPGVHGLGKTKRLQAAWKKAYPVEELPSHWQMTGMDSVEHRKAAPFLLTKAQAHPITGQLPSSWAIKSDELYQTLGTESGVIPLLKSGSDTVAWLHRYGKANVFGLTLSHDANTQNDPLFGELLSKGILFITGHLDDQGQVESGYDGHKNYSNYSGSIKCYPESIVEPSSIDEIQAAIKFANQQGLKVKVVSIDKSNSYSEILCPDQGGLLINVKKLNRLLSIDRAKLTVTVEPGLTIEALGKSLHKEGLSFATTADFTGITIAGGIATAAHHSSLTEATSMSEFVEALEFIDGQGEVRKYSGLEARQRATHLGVLGVVTSITLKVEPEFKLKYGFEGDSDQNLESTIEALVRGHNYSRVSWFAGSGRYVMEYFDRVPASEPGDSENNLWSSAGSAFRVIGDLPYAVLNNGPRALQCVGEALRSKLWIAPIKDTGSKSAKNPVGYAYKMLGSSCQTGSCPWDFGAKNRSIEIAIPLSQLKSWMQDVRQILAKDKACFPVLGIYLRFSPAASSWMSMAYGEDTVMFEIHIPTVEKQDIFEQSVEVYDEIQQLSLVKYQGRPHWGKNTKPAFTGVATRYPEWESFLNAQRELDPQGLFVNKFFQSIQGESLGQNYPACARSHDCYCQEQSDCGAGYSCQAGVAFSPAKICRKI